MRHVYVWGSIVALAAAAVAGDVFISLAMKRIGDVGQVYREHGLRATLGRVLGSRTLWVGVGFMSLGFFSLLFSLSWGDVSLVGPASASLTFIGNAFVAKVFLHERVDKRRWLAALLVAGGVALVAG